MKCRNHKTRDSVGTCSSCGNPFCDDCLVKVGRKNICKECVSDKLKGAEESSKSPNIVITQQTTNQQNSPLSGNALKGSGFWLCFWIVVCWPVAIIYFFMRKW